jgi:hypothetical protein
MWLYPGQSYWIIDGYVEIAGGIKLRIIGGIGGIIAMRMGRQG